MRRGLVEFDPCALFADERMVLVHHDGFSRTDGEPLSQLHIAEETSLRWCGRRGFLGLDWKVELAVIKHLGPETAIDKRANVFDEHAVFVRRHGLRNLLDIDFDI